MHDTPSHQSSNDDEINILLVEDNPGDIRFTREAFKTAEQEITFQIATNGYDAVSLLKRAVSNKAASLPDLILLDLNLPGRDGCSVLQTIRDDPQLKLLPVIMLTSSKADEDIARCYDAQANAYLTKPTDPAEFVAMVGTVEQFWFDMVRLPPTPQ